MLLGWCDSPFLPKEVLPLQLQWRANAKAVPLVWCMPWPCLCPRPLPPLPASVPSGTSAARWHRDPRKSLGAADAWTVVDPALQ